MRKTVVLAALMLSACGPEKIPASGDSVKGVYDRALHGEVILWATAPDGTKLWITMGPDSRYVYFSSSGAQSSYTTGGKVRATVDVIVPSARP